MYCMGVDLSPDWNALSAVGTLAAAAIALFIWNRDRKAKEVDRQGESRVVAMLMLSEIAAISSTSHTLASMVPRDAAAQRKAIEYFSKNPADLRSNLSLIEGLRTKRFERLAERSNVMPADVVTALAALLTSLRAIEMMIEALENRTELNGEEVVEVLMLAFGLHEDAKRTHLALAAASGASKEKIKALTHSLDHVPE